MPDPGDETTITGPPGDAGGHTPTPTPPNPSGVTRTNDPLLSDLVFRVGDTQTGGESEPLPPTATSAPPGYELLGVLGRGGMGVVFEARQVSLNRVVALKTVHGGALAGRAAVARFRAEAEAVAAVRHPNVVQVHEAGEHDGQPYMAMELCPGEPLTRRPKPLPPRDAAGLVEKIARGVAAAHAEGIVHRDLKPGNVLFDAAGEPKVADFGLAKRAAVDLTNTQATMGTPAYMAPEQAEGRAKFVGPPADVWALGVMLYELVGGKRPFDGETPDQILYQVMRGEPAAVRALNPGTPRDLDTVVAKCLAKDPARRYATAGELADDLARFLRGEPVSARRPAAWERAGRWCRRHPTTAVACGLGAVMVAGLAAAAALLFDAYHSERTAREAAVKARADADRRAVEADQNRERAEEKERDAVRSADLARRKGREATEVTDFLVRLFGPSDPLGGLGFGRGAADGAGPDGPPRNEGLPRGYETSTRELLEAGTDRLRGRLDDQPLVRAALLDTLGNVHRGLGLLPQARPLLEEGLRLRRRYLGEDHPDVAASLHNLGWLAQDEGHFAEAQRLYKLALDTRRRHLGGGHWLVTATLFNLAWVTAFQFDQITAGRQREAEELIREVMRRQEQWPDRGHGDPVVTRLALAFLIYSHGDTRRGEVDGILKDAVLRLPSSRLAGPILATMVKYAAAKQAREAFRLADAVRLNREVIEDARRVFGRDHAVVAYLLGDLAGLMNKAGDPAGAEAAIREALRIGRRLYPGGHWLLAKTLAEVGEHFRGLNRPEDAEEHFREGMAVAARCRRPDLFRRSRDGLADLLRDQGRPAEAAAVRAQPDPPEGRP